MKLSCIKCGTLNNLLGLYVMRTDNEPSCFVCTPCYNSWVGAVSSNTNPAPTPARQRVTEAAFTGKTPMPFGKHKGTPLDSVPADYLLWLYDQTDFAKKNPHLATYIETSGILEPEDAE